MWEMWMWLDLVVIAVVIAQNQLASLLIASLCVCQHGVYSLFILQPLKLCHSSHAVSLIVPPSLYLTATGRFPPLVSSLCAAAESRSFSTFTVFVCFIVCFVFQFFFFFNAAMGCAERLPIIVVSLWVGWVVFLFQLVAFILDPDGC